MRSWSAWPCFVLLLVPALPVPAESLPLPAISYSFEKLEAKNRVPDEAGLLTPKGRTFSPALLQFLKGGTPWDKSAIRKGQTGLGLRFGGPSTRQFLRVQLGPRVNLYTDDFSISFWVKTRHHQGVLLGSTTSAPYWHLVLTRRKELDMLLFMLNAGEGRQTQVVSFRNAPIIADGVWHSFVLVLDRTRSVRLFIDGSLAGLGDIRDQVAPLKNVLTLGGPYNYFEGDLDEFRLFQGCLSPEQVAVLARPGKRVPE